MKSLAEPGAATKKKRVKIRNFYKFSLKVHGSRHCRWQCLIIIIMMMMNICQAPFQKMSPKAFTIATTRQQ